MLCLKEYKELKMAHEAVLIFPHQLFEDHPCLEKKRPIFLVEHPRFFTDFDFHKQKLIFHRASMKAYEAFLKKKKYSVHYIELKEANKLYQRIKKENIETVFYCHVADHTLTKELQHQLKKKKIASEIVDSPCFMTPIAWIEKNYGKKKSFMMHSFYVKQRKRLKILIHANKPVGGKWSFDKENREPPSESITIPKIKKSRSNKWVTSAQKYVAKNWKNNYGNKDSFIYPIDHASAKRWLKDFLKNRLKEFGTYQDAMISGHPFMFHSLLSPLLNSGLLLPEYVVQEAIFYAKKHKISLNNLEGFIRQIIGWREYVHMVYHLKGAKQAKSNFFSARKKIPKSFWTGSTNIPPLDSSIEKVLEFAYAHHIERLMVLGNFMLLSGFAPKEVYRWFMELFIDSYDWVMVPNVYGMSQYADGGIMTTKPYISSSNYILKMSNFKKGDWCDMWDELFWKFIKKHYSKLKKIPRMGLLLNAYKKRKTT